MTHPGAWLTILVIGVLIGLPVEILRRRRLRIYWSRACAGREWREVFPDADKDEIGKFLQLFVDAFAFRGSRKLQFRPSDKFLDIYRACYPVKGWPDSLDNRIVYARGRGGLSHRLEPGLEPGDDTREGVLHDTQT